MTTTHHQLAIDMRANAQRWQEDGSPFYAELAARMADDVDEGGIVWEMLRDHAENARDEVPGPRLLAGGLVGGSLIWAFVAAASSFG